MLKEIKCMYLWFTRIMKVVTFLITVYRVVVMVQDILGCRRKCKSRNKTQPKSYAW